MRLRTFVLLFLILATLMLNACGKEASAKRKLKKLNIDFSAASLLEQVQRGNIEAVDLLLTARIDLTTDATGFSALMLAVKNNHKTIIPMLLSKGMDINEKNNNTGETALMTAAEVGDVGLVKYLVEKGAAVNTKDNNNATPLMRAAMGGNAAIAQELLDNGADLFAKDNDGLSASMIGAIHGNIDIVRLLKKAGATEPLEEIIFADLLGKYRSEPIIKRFMDTVPDWQTSIYDHGATVYEISKPEGISLLFEQDRLTAIDLYSSAYNTSTYKRSRLLVDLFTGKIEEPYKQFAGTLPYDISFSDSNKDIHRKIGRRPERKEIDNDILYRIDEDYFLKWYKLFVTYDTESKNILNIRLRVSKNE